MIACTAVEQRISLVRLGVADVFFAKAFDEALGRREREFEQTVFFQAGGLAVVLWRWDELVADSDLRRLRRVADPTGICGRSRTTRPSR